MTDMFIETGGAGDASLVLLHGLGATASVWRPMTACAARHWNGSWAAIDLPGHGRSTANGRYALTDMAGRVAEAIDKRGLAEKPLIILGHSLGGVIALALAGGGFGIQPSGVFGLGIKVAWTEEERAGLAQRAGAPAKYYPTRDEAFGRYVKAAGLAGLVEPDSPVIEGGVFEADGGWRLAADPRTAEVGPPPMNALLEQVRCPVHLACGANDPMVTVDQLRIYQRDAEALAGLGHNAMVENPEAVWGWVRRYF